MFDTDNTYEEAEERLPYCSAELIAHLRLRREWQDRIPPREWTMDQVQYAIGANAVIRYLEELHAHGAGL